MHSENTNVAAAIRCPRCGYDQRGVVATWTKSCPLQGTCSECGLVFNWAEVIVPEKFEPRWCVEFVPRKRSIPLACVKTFFKSFWPWTFWSRLKMSQPIRPARLVIYLIALLSPFLACYVILQATLALYARSQVQQAIVLGQQTIAQQTAQTRTSLHSVQQELQRRAAPAEERGPPPSTQASQRRSLAAWSMEQLKTSDQLLQQELASLNLMATPPTLNQSHIAAMIEAIIFPLRNWSWGSIQHADGTVSAYPAPVQLHRMSNWWWPGSYSRDFPMQVVLGLLSAAILTILLPGCLILLPASRRRAKVRWPHVWRITIYSLFALVLMVMIGFASVLWIFVNPNRTVVWIAINMPVIVWVVLPIWWAVAIRRYLRMPHAGAVAGLMTLMLALLMLPLLAIAMPKWLVDLVLD